MLNSIFNKYSKGNKSETERERESDNLNKTNNLNKYNKNNNLPSTKEEEKDFLNEQIQLSMKTKSDEAMKKYCSLYDNTEDEFSVKPLNYKFTEKKEKKLENSNCTGPGWFNMKAPEMTPELKQDLKAIQLRHISDPARFYKKMDKDNLPKYFQVGTIMDNIMDGKNSRLKKTEVKSRIAEEFLETDMAKNYSLRKFEELQGVSRNLGLKKSKLNKYKMQARKKGRKSEMVTK